MLRYLLLHTHEWTDEMLDRLLGEARTRAPRRTRARDHGADVVSFPYNRGLRAGIAEGYRQALKRDYAHCGRLDADGQHLA